MLLGFRDSQFGGFRVWVRGGIKGFQRVGKRRSSMGYTSVLLLTP